MRGWPSSLWWNKNGFSSVAFAFFCIVCVWDAACWRIGMASAQPDTPPPSNYWNSCIFLVMASYILHRITSSPTSVPQQKKKWISYSIKQSELSECITLKWHFFTNAGVKSKRKPDFCCLIVTNPLILFINGFIGALHFLLPLFFFTLYGSSYLSIRCVCERAQSSWDYYDCEEEVSASPGTPAWLAPQMIQARV